MVRTRTAEGEKIQTTFRKAAANVYVNNNGSHFFLLFPTVKEFVSIRLYLRSNKMVITFRCCNARQQKVKQNSDP